MLDFIKRSLKQRAALKRARQRKKEKTIQTVYKSPLPVYTWDDNNTDVNHRA